MQRRLEAASQYLAVGENMINSEGIARKGIITYMIDVESADPCALQRVVAQMHRRVMTAVELLSAYGDALPFHNHIVPYYMFLSTEVLYTRR